MIYKVKRTNYSILIFLNMLKKVIIELLHEIFTLPLNYHLFLYISMIGKIMHKRYMFLICLLLNLKVKFLMFHKMAIKLT